MRGRRSDWWHARTWCGSASFPRLPCIFAFHAIPPPTYAAPTTKQTIKTLKPQPSSTYPHSIFMMLIALPCGPPGPPQLMDASPLHFAVHPGFGAWCSLRRQRAQRTVSDCFSRAASASSTLRYKHQWGWVLGGWVSCADEARGSNAHLRIVICVCQSPHQHSCVHSTPDQIV